MAPLNENGEIDIVEVKGMLKKLSGVLMLEGLPKMNIPLMVIGNTLSITMASLDCGEEMTMELMKALAPIGERIAGQIKTNPALKGLKSVRASDMMKDGELDMEAIKNIALEGLLDGIDINDALSGTGATLNDDDEDNDKGDAPF